jgi:hypothetical protein
MGGGLSVTVSVAAGQANPTNTGPINFTVTFSEPASGFVSGDVIFTGSTVGGTLAAAVSGGPTVYNVAVTGMTGNGIVAVNVPAGSATNTKGANFPVSNTATVTFDTTAPTATINKAVGQADPTAISPITFTVAFNEAVTGFLASDIVITGTAGGTKAASLSGGPVSYNVEITGMTTAGTVVINFAAGAATDLAGNTSALPTVIDNSVDWSGTDITRPNVTINKGASQADPTSTSPIIFDVVFTEPVINFVSADVTVTFTGGGTPTAVVSGGPTSYTVTVTGMTTDGNVTASIAANVCTDAAGNLNFASTSTDNIVAWVAGGVPVGDLKFNSIEDSGLIILLEDL